MWRHTVSGIWNGAHFTEMVQPEFRQSLGNHGNLSILPSHIGNLNFFRVWLIQSISLFYFSASFKPQYSAFQCPVENSNIFCNLAFMKYQCLNQWFPNYGSRPKVESRDQFSWVATFVEMLKKMYIFHKVRTCLKTIVGLFMVPKPTLYIPTPAWMPARYMLFIPMV